MKLLGATLICTRSESADKVIVRSAILDVLEQDKPKFFCFKQKKFFVREKRVTRYHGECIDRHWNFRSDHSSIVYREDNCVDNEKIRGFLLLVNYALRVNDFEIKDDELQLNVSVLVRNNPWHIVP